MESCTATTTTVPQQLPPTVAFADTQCPEIAAILSPGDELVIDPHRRYSNGGSGIYVRNLPGTGAVVWWHPGQVIPPEVELDRLPTTTLREVRALNVMPLPRMLVAVLRTGYSQADVAEAAARVLEASGIVAIDISRRKAA